MSTLASLSPTHAPTGALGRAEIPGGRTLGSPLAARRPMGRPGGVSVRASWKEKLAKTWKDMQFESWAPPSSRAWRLRELPSEVSLKAAAEEAARMEAEEAAPGDVLAFREMLESLPAAPAKEDASAAFAARVAMMEEQADQEGEDVEDLTGKELIQMCYEKYGKYHDMSIKQTRMTTGEGAKRWVAMNIYIGHYGQKSFPYTQSQYVEKSESVAYMLNAWNQQSYVRDFFAEPPIPRRGLPSHPRVDTAVSLRLNKSPNWDDKLTEGFFTY